jgi:hypothetical protein
MVALDCAAPARLKAVQPLRPQLCRQSGPWPLAQLSSGPLRDPRAVGSGSCGRAFMTQVAGCGHKGKWRWTTTPCAPWSVRNRHTAAKRLPSATLLSSPHAMLRPSLASECWHASEAAHAKHPRLGLQHCQRIVPSKSRTRSSGWQCSIASASHRCHPMRSVASAAVPRSSGQKTATTRWCALQCRGRP